MIQVKIMEADALPMLMDDVNTFLAELDERDVVDVKYQTNMSFTAEEELKSYSALILYGVRKLPYAKGR